jgi:hypothetical protein
LLAQEITRVRVKTHLMMELSTVKISKSSRKRIKKRILAVLSFSEEDVVKMLLRKSKKKYVDQDTLILQPFWKISRANTKFLKNNLTIRMIRILNLLMMMSTKSKKI